MLGSTCSIGEFGSAVGSADAGRDSALPSDEASVWTLVSAASGAGSVRAVVVTAADEASVRIIEGTASDEASVWPLSGTDSVLADSADDPTPRSPWGGFSVRLRALGHRLVRALLAVFHASMRAFAKDL